MDSTGVLQLLEQLDDEVDDLEEALSSVLGNALSPTLSKLPVLDKAKLYVLMTYAIESILFSYLRLHGVKAREHPVFKELTRVKQYFDKIKIAESPLPKRENLSLDKVAAGRIFKAALSGNDKYDLELAERKAKERARAYLKGEEITRRQEAAGKHIRFEVSREEQETESGSHELEDGALSDPDSESDASSEPDTNVDILSTKKRKADTLLPSKPDFDENEMAETPEAKRKKGSGAISKKEKNKKKRKSKSRRNPTEKSGS